MNRLTISIAAGKGGTGKTLVATSLAVALNQRHPGDAEILDCDVEEPNVHILLHPRIAERQPVHILVPQVDEAVCARCGTCAEVCEFSAIAVIREAVLTFPNLCSGCGACAYACPLDAISEAQRNVGAIAIGATVDGIAFYEGRVNVGEQRSGPVTKAVKHHIHSNGITIIDAPPGTACPMQESIEGSDYCILVTEPTPFGLSDLRAAVDTCRSLGVPCGIVINRDGVGDTGVEQYCIEEGLPVLLRIPQERAIAEAYSRGETLTHAFPEWVESFCEMIAEIESYLSLQEVT